ncbi:hypothetical protein L1049_001333 [Liquidambar formosana]|uniref:Uncharacterized protein n=1 Tax=Liquidambar formosana TaxID=63359 RepID=A0AAP0NC98_LIQFO
MLTLNSSSPPSLETSLGRRQPTPQKSHPRNLTWPPETDVAKTFAGCSLIKSVSDPPLPTEKTIVTLKRGFWYSDEIHR